MINFKSFLLGMGVAYGIYIITRKGKNGRSVLDDMLDHPEEFMEKAKDYAVAEAVETVKTKLS